MGLRLELECDLLWVAVFGDSATCMYTPELQASVSVCRKADISPPQVGQQPHRRTVQRKTNNRLRPVQQRLQDHHGGAFLVGAAANTGLHTQRRAQIKKQMQTQKQMKKQIHTPATRGYAGAEPRMQALTLPRFEGRSPCALNPSKYMNGHLSMHACMYACMYS